jgi:glycosyltransferase involved in cell wall biosynthesis
VVALFATWRAATPNSTFPLLTWIPDFQHLHLPQLFTPKEIDYRNKLFRRIADTVTRIIVSSETARIDFEKYYPEAAVRARVLPFTAQVPENTYTVDPREMCELYHLPERFIHLPNQFWQHKNHELVVQALSILKTKHPEITVVCTGNTNDNRAPLYFGQLLAKIAQAGLREQMVLLGWVPYEHLFQLMRQSVAILQPSVFEGWSTTVEEAKSLGKPLLVSDIVIHREQNPTRAIFFSPHDAEALAQVMVRAYEEFRPGPDAEQEAGARKMLALRTRDFGQRFVNIVTDAITSRPTTIDG